MKRYFVLLLLICAGCGTRAPSDQSDTIVSMQLIDRNGFSETISNKDRLSTYQTTNFLTPQPYQKILRVYGRNLSGQSTSRITSYHDNGQIWQYLDVIDGRANGYYREWFANGQLKIEAPVVEGTPDIGELAIATWVFDGLSKVYSDQGALTAEIPYAKGTLHASSRYYFSSGKLQKIIPYEQGEIHGLTQVFDENGELLEETPYSKGEKHGKAFAYRTPGNLLFTECYEGGHLIDAVYYDVASQPVATIKDGHGKQAQYNGELLEKFITFQRGVPEGEVQVFSPSGNLHCSYNIVDEMKNGEEWEYYPQDPSRPKLCVHWHDDRIEGQVKTWYPSGQPESQREINNNKKQGMAFAWYKNGDLMLLEEYENDLLLKGSYYKKGTKKPSPRLKRAKAPLLSIRQTAFS